MPVPNAPVVKVLALTPPVRSAASTLDSKSVWAPTCSEVLESVKFASRVAKTLSVRSPPLKAYVPLPVLALKTTVSAPAPPLIVRFPLKAGSSALRITWFGPSPRLIVRLVTVSAGVMRCVSPPPLKSIENVLSVAVPLSAMTMLAAPGASIVMLVVPLTNTGSMPE